MADPKDDVLYIKKDPCPPRFYESEYPQWQILYAMFYTWKGIPTQHGFTMLKTSNGSEMASWRHLTPDLAMADVYDTESMKHRIETRCHESHEKSEILKSFFQNFLLFFLSSTKKYLFF